MNYNNIDHHVPTTQDKEENVSGTFQGLYASLHDVILLLPRGNHYPEFWFILTLFWHICWYSQTVGGLVADVLSWYKWNHCLNSSATWSIKSKHPSPSSPSVQGVKCCLFQILGINATFVLKRTINVSIHSLLGVSMLISKITQLTAFDETPLVAHFASSTWTYKQLSHWRKCLKPLECLLIYISAVLGNRCPGI